MHRVKDWFGRWIDRRAFATSILVLIALAIWTPTRNAVEGIFRGSPSAAEKAADTFYSDARLAPWVSEPHPLEGSRRYLENHYRALSLPANPNTFGGETQAPKRLALEVERWVGQNTLIRNGYVLNLRAIRAVTVPSHGEYELESGAVFIAQIVPTEQGPEHPGSIFCEFTQAVQHGETLRFPHDVEVQAEGVPIMFGTANGAEGIPGPAAFFVCNGMAIVRPPPEMIEDPETGELVTP
jgi:hypothetical protein